MSFISVFDVMGPNMIGPSSSHTAGAARIGFLAQKMINGPLKKVEFTLYGSLPAPTKATEQTVPCSEVSWDFPRMICVSEILSRLQIRRDLPFHSRQMKSRRMCTQIQLISI